MSVRRRASRSHAGGLSARVRPGHHVQVVDVSTGGALFEAPRPLRPGADVEVLFERADRRLRLTATVLRCGIAAIDPERGPTYRAAVSFSESFEWAREDMTLDGHAMPDEHTRRTRFWSRTPK